MPNEEPPVIDVDPISKLLGDIDDSPKPPENPPKEKEAPKEKAPPPPKNKEVQVSELRKAKDKAEAELSEALKKIEAAEKLNALKPVAEYIEKKAGKLDEEAVNKYIERNKERKKVVSESEQKLKDKEQLLQQISVDHSEEFKEGFIKPLEESKNNLLAIIAPLDNEQKIKNPQLVNELFKDITRIDNKGQPLTALQIKAALVAFETKYRRATGEDYDMPDLTQVHNNVISVSKNLVSTINAKNNWSKVQEERNKERLFEQAKASELAVKKEVEGRKYITKKVIEEYDFEPIEDIIPRDEFIEGINENNTFLNDVLTQSKKKEYKELLLDMTKAKFFDKMVETLKQTKDQLKAEKAKNKAGLPQGGPPPRPQGEKRVAGSDPLAYLNT